MPPTIAQLRDKDTPAPSRIGQMPTYGLPAANGAAVSGFDSLNRTRKKPKLLSGAGQAEAAAGSRQSAPPDRPASSTAAPLRLSIPPSQSANKTPLPPAMAGTVRRPAAAQAAEGR